MTRYTCKLCGEIFDVKNEKDFDEYGDEMLWGHIQMQHEDKFEEIQNLDTPDMLDECYEETNQD